LPVKSILRLFPIQFWTQSDFISSLIDARELKVSYATYGFVQMTCAVTIVEICMGRVYLYVSLSLSLSLSLASVTSCNDNIHISPHNNVARQHMTTTMMIQCMQNAILF